MSRPDPKAAAAAAGGAAGLLSKLKLDSLLPPSPLRRFAESASETGSEGADGSTGDMAAADDLELDQQQVGNERRRRSDEEIVATLPSEFFVEHFNATAFVLNHLPARLDDAFFDTELYEKERAHDIMNSRLSKKVMDNYGEFVSGMTQIHELSVDLQTSANVCKTGRRGLQAAKTELVERVVHIVARHRRLRMFRDILRQAQTVRALLAAAKEVARRQQEGDWPGAIQLLLAVRAALAQLKPLQCVKQLAHSLQLQYQMIDERLDQAVSQLVRSFDPQRYARVLVGLRLLGQSYLVLEKLQRAFADLINTNAKNVLYAHALMSDANARQPELLRHMKFVDLCNVIKEEHFATALDSLLEITSELMFVHEQMLGWRRTRPPSHQLIQPLDAPAIFAELPGAAQADAATAAGEAAALDDFLSELHDGLDKFKKNIWDDVQRKVATLLSAAANGRVAAMLKVDEMLTLLEHVNAFVDIGEQFAAGSEAHALRLALRQVSRAYFDAWHRQRAEDLQTMLDNEMWQRCPVLPQFGVHDIKEVHALLTSPLLPSASSAAASNVQLPVSDAADAGADADRPAPQQPLQLGPGGAYHPLALFGTLGNPFAKGYKPRAQANTSSGGDDGQQQRAEGTTSGSDDDDTDAPESVEDGIDSDATRRAVTAAAAASSAELQQGGGALLTTTTINLCRHLAKYIQLMKLMQPIASDVFDGLQQLYHYYLFSVYALFGEEPPAAGQLDPASDSTFASAYQMSPRLRSTLARLLRQFRPAGPTAAAGTATPLLGQSATEFGKTLQNAISGTTVAPAASIGAATASAASSSGGGSAAVGGSESSAAAASGSGSGAAQSSLLPVLRVGTVSVDLSNAATLYGLQHRVVAVESLTFVHSVLSAVRPHLQALLPRARDRQLREFYAQSVDIVPELSAYMYKTLAVKLIGASCDGLVGIVERVKWDIKELGTDGSAYVDRLLADFRNLAKRLAALARHVPGRVRDLLWQAAITHAMQLLVEGYSRVKKCTNEGRAIMSLDLNNLRTALEQLSKLRPPLPGVKHVEAYIKAYYLAEVDILPWCHEHQADYSLRQLQSIVTLGVGRTMKKHKLDELLNAISDIFRTPAKPQPQPPAAPR
eukprot:TRINITY_DN9902_c0_g2_i1.p1 TRINITY_DN9902_c0_g2~~TRINITY_DN9902_c0_g2_i1.p1  ORF type:complete len:1117 (+),score=551.47 TRINITY_DN9902_c0_g2_i1:130-3480(+)